MGRLLEIEPAEVLKDPVQCAIDAAKAWKQVVVLKSGYTVATDGQRTLVAEEAPVSLATAGSGDVFAGTIGALLAQGLAPLDAAALAIHVGSQAATLAAGTFGDLGVLASDLPDAIARSMKELQ
jgi:NAD(P)H-hydrate epimerase